MKNIVPFILGPTAVGKTKLSVLLAEELNMEVVSADSRQVYRGLDIGTAKVEKEIRRRIPHHCIDICEINAYFSAGRYAREARRIIAEIQKRDKWAVVVGGSGLYIKALTEGFFEGDIKDESIREQLNRELDEKGLNILYAQLQKTDPLYAERISSNDRQRILRGLEVLRITGRPFSEWLQKEKQPASFKPLLFGLKMNRERLYRRINNRVDLMLGAGLINEARRLQEKGFSQNLNALNTVGYKEVFLYLKNKVDYDTMVEKIKQNSRRYAKRQMTWFKKDPRILWFNCDTEKDLLTVRDQMLSLLVR